MVAINCYLEKENDKVLKLHVNNSYYFKVCLPRPPLTAFFF